MMTRSILVAYSSELKMAGPRRYWSVMGPFQEISRLEGLNVLEKVVLGRWSRAEKSVMPMVRFS
jgi:hypothetical protein